MLLLRERPELKILIIEKAAAFSRRVDRKSTRLNSSHSQISYAVFCLKKKKQHPHHRASIVFLCLAFLSFPLPPHPFVDPLLLLSTPSPPTLSHLPLHHAPR